MTNKIPIHIDTQEYTDSMKFFNDDGERCSSKELNAFIASATITKITIGHFITELTLEDGRRIAFEGDPIERETEVKFMAPGEFDTE